MDRLVGAIGSWSLFAFPLFALGFIAVFVFAGTVAYEVCDRGEDCRGLDSTAVGLVALLLAIAFEATMLSLGAGMAYVARTFRRRKLERKYRPRREAVRDWLAGGDISRQEYDAIAPRLDRAMAGAFAGERVWAASDLLLVVGGLSIAFSPLTLLIFALSGEQEAAIILASNTSAWLGVLGAGSLVVALTSAPLARSHTRQFTRAVDSALERLADESSRRHARAPDPKSTARRSSAARASP